MKLDFNRYKVHLVVGMIFFPFLVISTLTGFFRANYKWFWKENYKKVKNHSINKAVTAPALHLGKLLDSLQTANKAGLAITEVKLRSESGHLLYDIRTHKGKPLLIDAMTGRSLSPLSLSMAQDFAMQYVNAGMKIISAKEESAYITRKDKKEKAVYVFEFDDPLHTSIYIDKASGEIEEEVDDNLKFGFWMVKLHDYDFFGSKRFILSFAGAGLFILSLTGFYLWLRKRKMKKKIPSPKIRILKKEPVNY
jgi:uncharacterized iron-regulated membrane protein